MSISKDGIEFIKKREGLRLFPYQDDNGVWTVGWGHTFKRKEDAQKISYQDALKYLDQDIKEAEQIVNNAVKVKLSQGQYDALVSLVFNWGGDKFSKSVGLKKLNTGDYQGALYEFIEVNKIGGVVSKGLMNRRLLEAAMFNNLDIEDNAKA